MTWLTAWTVTPTSLERWARQEAQGRVRRLWQQQEEDNKALASTDEEGRYSCESGEAYHLLQALWPSRKLLTCAKTIAIILGVFNRTFPSSMDKRTNIAFWHTPYFHPSSLLIMRKSCSVPGMGDVFICLNCISKIQYTLVERGWVRGSVGWVRAGTFSTSLAHLANKCW